MPLQNFGIVYRGLARHGQGLYRCGQPDAQGFADLATLGVRFIVKLNSESEYPVDRERAEFPQGGIYAREVSTFHPKAADVRDVVEVITGELARGYNIAVHCTHGRDRTGLVIGAWRLLHDKWRLEDVLRERELYGSTGIVALATHEIEECLRELAG